MSTVSILTRARSRNLIQVASVEARLGSSGETTLITELVQEASEAIASLLGYAPWRERIHFTFPGNAANEVLVPRVPIESIESVTFDGQTLDDVEIGDRHAGLLYRAAGWPWTGQTFGIANDALPGTEARSFAATIVAGYVVPDLVQAYANGSVTLGQFIRPTDLAASPYLFEVTTAGSLVAEPDWSTAEVGDTITAGGTAVLTCRDALELPAPLRQACFEEVKARYRSLRRESAVAAVSVEGASVTYRAADDLGDGPLLSRDAERRCSPFRRWA